MRILKILALLLFSAAAAYGQSGTLFNSDVRSTPGPVVPGALVTVCTSPAAMTLPCTPKATIYTDPFLSNQANNPIQADGNGNYNFYAPSGTYVLSVTGRGLPGRTYTVQLPCSAGSTVTGCAAGANILPLPNTFTNINNFAGGLNIFGLPGIAGKGAFIVGDCLNIFSLVPLQAADSGGPCGGGGGGGSVIASPQFQVAYFPTAGSVATVQGSPFTTDAVGDITVPGTSSIAGPNPYIDAVSTGAFATASVAQSVASCNGTSTITLTGGVSTFKNNEGITVEQCGATNPAATPAFPIVTSVVAHVGQGTGDVVPGLVGSTTYQYCIISRDIGQGLTACSSTAGSNGQITTGASTLGPFGPTPITSMSRTNNVVTVTCGSACGVANGAEVYITNSTDPTFSGFYNQTTVIDTTHFTYVQGQDTREGASTGSTGGTLTVYNANHLTIPNLNYQYYVYKFNGSNFVFDGIVRPGETTWDDFGQTPPARPLWVPNIAPSSNTNDSLTTTIVSGQGTTSLVLANAASQTISGQVAIKDDAPTLAAAYAIAAGNATSSAMRISSAATGTAYVLNSYSTWTGGVPATVQMGHELLINDTLNIQAGANMTGITGGTSNSAAGGFSSGYYPQIHVGTGYPAIAAGSTSSQFNYLAFVALNDQSLVMTVSPGGGFGFSMNNVSCELTPTDTMGMCLVTYGVTQLFLNNDLFSTNDTLGYGESLTPTVYERNDIPNLNGSGQMRSDGTSWVGRGYIVDSNPPSGGFNNYVFNNNYCQACRTPFITVGSLNGPTVILRSFINDTSSTADIANMGANQLDAIIDGVGDNGSETNGTPGITTGSTFASIQYSGPATQVGQNVNLNRFRTDVSIDGINGTTPSAGTLQDFQTEVRFGQSYSWDFPLLASSAVSTIVSSGGSIPVGSWTYGFTAFDATGRSTGISSSVGSCVTTSGNQTCTTTIATPVTGAANYSYYRQSPPGSGYNGIAACLHVTSLTCVDTAATAGGGSPPATSTAGTTYADATHLGTQNVVLVGPAGAAVSPTCTLTFSTNTCGWSGGGGGFTAGGDLTGTSTSQQVVGLRGLTLPSLGAATGYFFDNGGTLQLSTSASNFTSGTLPHPQLPALLSGDIPNNAANTSGNAATATALASAPSLCSTGFAPTGVLASGNATGCASIASGLTTQTNGTNNISQATLNLINSAAFNGLTFTFTNTGTGTVQAGFTGTLGNAGLTNSATTVNNQTCTLGSACTIPFQVNNVNNGSLSGLNFLTSTVNAAGVTVTPSNPSTNTVKFEVTGSLTSTYPQTVVGGVSGGIPCFTSTTNANASTLLGSGQFVLGGGAGACPTTSFSVVPIANGGTGAATTSAHFWLGRPQGTSGAPSLSLIGTSDTTPNQCATDTGTANAYVIAPSPAATALVNGLEVCFTPANNNTSTVPTLNVSGLGAATITNPGGSALITPQLLTTAVAVLRYNSVSTDWELQGGGSSGGGGTTNPGSQFSLAQYPNVGSSNVIGPISSPSSPNGQTYFVCSTPAAGAATAPAFCLPGVPGRTVSGTTDTIAFTDRTTVVNYTSNSAVSVTLPQAGSTNFGSNFPFVARYTGTNILTITPTTSTINGVATLQMGTDSFCFIYSLDNANYLSNCTNGGGVSPVVADSGSANAYVVSYPLVQALTAGASVYFTTANVNTGASTINVNGLGVKNLTKNGSQALITGDILTSTIYYAMYDGTEWQVVNPSATVFGSFSAHKYLGNNTSGSATAAPVSIGSSDVSPNWYATDSGTANAYVVAPTPAVTALTIGTTVFFVTSNANTGASTIAVSGLTTKALDKKGATALVAGDILANAVYQATYDGTEWQLINPSTSSGGANNCSVAKSAAYYAGTGTTVSCLSEADLTQYLYIADSGSVNAYVLTLAPALATLNVGNVVSFTTTHSNTAASTVNVNGLGVKNITRAGTNALVGGEILSGVIYDLQWDGTEWQLLNPSVLLSGATPPACAGTTPAGPGCFTEGTAATAVAGVDDLHADSTQKGMEVNNNNTGEMMLSRANCVNVTPVTVNANVTTDQNLMTCTIAANTMNVVGRTMHVHAAGIFTTAAASTAQITAKAKLCTVSGCATGTVLTLMNIQTVAIGTLTITNNNWNLDFYATTQTAGASAVFEAHGQLVIDLGSLTSTADSVYGDTNTGTLSPIDTTGGTFLQITFAYSAGSASNSVSQRQGVVEWLN